MIRNILTAALSGAALTIAGPALAGPGHGGGLGGGLGAAAGAGMSAGSGMNGGTSLGGPSQAAINARINSQGSLNASPMGISHANTNSALSTGSTVSTRATPSAGTNYSTNSQAAAHSQALLHASPTAIAHANSNSVLARGAVSSTTLAGLNTGLTVQTSSGTAIGTITQVISGPNNTIRAVVVTSASGQTYTLPANSLSISGSVVTTTSISG